MADARDAAGVLRAMREPRVRLTSHAIQQAGLLRLVDRGGLYYPRVCVFAVVVGCCWLFCLCV